MALQETTEDKMKLQNSKTFQKIQVTVEKYKVFFTKNASCLFEVQRSFEDG